MFETIHIIAHLKIVCVEFNKMANGQIKVLIHVMFLKMSSWVLNTYLIEIVSKATINI